jgi:hypothetical protein
MRLPLAELGFYLNIVENWNEDVENPPKAIECTSPEEACQVTINIPGRPPIPSGATNWQDFSVKPEGLSFHTGDQPDDPGQRFDPPGCKRGYARTGCAVCSTKAGDKHYRQGKSCLPCPVTGFTFWQLLAAVLLAFLLAAVAFAYLGHWFSDAQVANQLVTPLIILVGFLQTLSVVIEMNMRWPSVLVDLFTWFSIFSIKYDRTRELSASLALVSVYSCVLMQN